MVWSSVIHEAYQNHWSWSSCHSSHFETYLYFEHNFANKHDQIMSLGLCMKLKTIRLKQKIELNLNDS
jgi:hypothetical protein